MAPAQGPPPVRAALGSTPDNAGVMLLTECGSQPWPLQATVLSKSVRTDTALCHGQIRRRWAGSIRSCARRRSYGRGTGGCRAGMQGREPGAAPVRAWRDRSFPSASANAWKLGYFSYGLSRCRCGCGVKTGPVGPDPGAQTGAPRNVAGPAASDRTVRSRFLPAGSPPSCSPTPHKVAGGK